jgi:excisionase family DNA binding protein
MQDEFLSLGQAARRLGVSEFALRRRIAGGEIPVYDNPRDRRSRLIAVSDLEAYATPRRLPPTGAKANTGRNNAGELQGVA